MEKNWDVLYDGSKWSSKAKLQQRWLTTLAEWQCLPWEVWLCQQHSEWQFSHCNANRYRGTAWRRRGRERKPTSNTLVFTFRSSVLSDYPSAPDFQHGTLLLLLTPLCWFFLLLPALGTLSFWPETLMSGRWGGQKSGGAMGEQWESLFHKHFLLKRCLFRLWDASRRQSKGTAF